MLREGAEAHVEEPLMVRLLAPGRAWQLEALHSRILQVHALNWTYELRFWSIAAAMDRALVLFSPAMLALASSTPAGTFDRGPSVIHQKVLRLPRLHF